MELVTSIYLNCIVLQNSQSSPPVVEHLGRIVGSVSLRDVWTDAAQLLMQQVPYHTIE